MSTLSSIAKELNVSVSLVSKVLNGKLGTTGASPATVQAIHDAARRMNYRKNLTAAALATGRQHVLGVFIHHHGSVGSGISEATIVGIAHSATITGQRLMLRFYNGEAEFLAACRETPHGSLDGLVVAGVLHDELARQLEQMQRQQVAVVTVLDRRISPRIPNVGSDQMRVGELATTHLIERGCRRIAHIRVQAERYAGYQQALRAAGMPELPELVFESQSYAHDAGAAAVRHWCEAGLRFDGVVGQSDQHAAGAITELQRRGLAVPGDVKVVGVDNSPYCNFFPIPITSVSQEDEPRGELACDLLLKQINGQAVRSVEIPPVLHVRASS